MKTLTDLHANPSMELIMRKMITEIGLTVHDIDFDDPAWFSKHTWTEKQQNDFLEWLIEFLSDYSHLKEVAQFPFISKSLKMRKKIANWFIFQYGWRCDYESKS